MTPATLDAIDAMRARDRAFGDGESEAADSIAMDRHALLTHVAASRASAPRATPTAASDAAPPPSTASTRGCGAASAAPRARCSRGTRRRGG
jgi:hypothetical protein